MRLIALALAAALAASCSTSKAPTPASSPPASPASASPGLPSPRLTMCEPQLDRTTAMCELSTGGSIRVAVGGTAKNVCLYEPEGWDADDTNWVPAGWYPCPR